MVEVVEVAEVAEVVPRDAEANAATFLEIEITWEEGSAKSYSFNIQRSTFLTFNEYKKDLSCPCG